MVNESLIKKWGSTLMEISEARITNPKEKRNRLTRLVMNSIDFRIRSLSHLARFEMETAEDSRAVPPSVAQ